MSNLVRRLLFSLHGSNIDDPHIHVLTGPFHAFSNSETMRDRPPCKHFGGYIEMVLIL